MMISPREIVGKMLGFQGQIDELQRRINELSWDGVFGMWTRTAFIQFCRVMPRGERTLAFIDLNSIHAMNNRHGYEEVDRRVRAAFAIPFRKSDIVARWYSGDEIVILFDSDRSGAITKIRELERSAARQGLTFDCELGTWQVGASDVVETVSSLSNASRLKQLSMKGGYDASRDR